MVQTGQTKAKSINDKNKNTLVSLKKASSLLNKIIDMVEEDKYCIDIIQQNLAVVGLLKSVNLKLLEGHLSCCFIDSIKLNDKKTQLDMIQEVLMIVKTAQNK